VSQAGDNRKHETQMTFNEKSFASTVFRFF
jgi:hypothetical protein